MLAFCPVSDVVKDFKELQENLPEPLRPMIEYVAQNLQGGTVLSSKIINLQTVSVSAVSVMTFKYSDVLKYWDT